MSNALERHKELTCNEESKLILLKDLVRVGGYSSFSYILDSYAFSRWKNRYQLDKALKQLIADGYVVESFKGHNRYGYMRYGASEKAKERVRKNAEAKEAFDAWLHNYRQGGFE